MEFCCSYENYLVKEIVNIGGSVLQLFSNGAFVAECKFPEEIRGIALSDERLFCLIQYFAKEVGDENKVVLHTFDMELHELSRETLESNPNGGFCSCMDMSYIYILHYNTAWMGMDCGGRSLDLDVVAEITFLKISRKTGERTEWKLNDFEDDSACSLALEKVAGSGLVTSIYALSILDGRLIFKCDVFDPDSVIENDDPDFGENELSEADYVEYHSFPYTICVDLDAKELSYVANNQ